MISAILGLAGISLLYPLLRFAGFTVKPKPRYVVVKRTIPVGDAHTDHDFILFNLKEGPLAVSRRCTHLGCRVHYRPELEQIECPCHQSRFTPAGVRVSGPAQRNLTVFPVRELLDENGVVTGYEVTL
ncbi:MAG: hypothetical protein Kow0089_17740 [Desulfobulbaceae bacterium]